MNKSRTWPEERGRVDSESLQQSQSLSTGIALQTESCGALTSDLVLERDEATGEMDRPSRLNYQHLSHSAVDQAVKPHIGDSHE